MNYNKIYNPETGRQVNLYSAKGKRILSNYFNMLGGADQTNHCENETTPKGKKKCIDDKICNPATGRCVKRTGAIGKAILTKKAKSPPRAAKAKSPPRVVAEVESPPRAAAKAKSPPRVVAEVESPPRAAAKVEGNPPHKVKAQISESDSDDDHLDEYGAPMSRKPQRRGPPDTTFIKEIKRNYEAAYARLSYGNQYLWDNLAEDECDFYGNRKSGYKEVADRIKRELTFQSVPNENDRASLHAMFEARCADRVLYHRRKKLWKALDKAHFPKNELLHLPEHNLEVLNNILRKFRNDHTAANEIGNVQGVYGGQEFNFVYTAKAFYDITPHEYWINKGSPEEKDRIMDNWIELWHEIEQFLYTIYVSGKVTSALEELSIEPEIDLFNHIDNLI